MGDLNSHYPGPRVGMPLPTEEELYQASRQAQLNRTEAIQLLGHNNGRRIIVGSFVRVLVQMPSGTDGYVISRVRCTEEGEPYVGFTTSDRESTTYLVLDLPPNLVSLNGPHFQLGSVSNRVMERGEFTQWLRAMPRPCLEEINSVVERCRAALLVGPAMLAAAKPRRRTGASSISGTRSEISADPMTVAEQSGNGVVGRSGGGDQILRQNIMNEFGRNYLLVTKQPNRCSLSELQETELVLMQYLKTVRETITDLHPCCIVCRERYPSVVFVPCMHRLCKSCVSSIKESSKCVHCRHQIVEMFEPLVMEEQARPPLERERLRSGMT